MTRVSVRVCLAMFSDKVPAGVPVLCPAHAPAPASAAPAPAAAEEEKKEPPRQRLAYS